MVHPVSSFIMASFISTYFLTYDTNIYILLNSRWMRYIFSNQGTIGGKNTMC